MDRKELARRVRQHQDALRKRHRAIFRLACIGSFVFFFAYAFVTYTEKSADISAFRQTCSEIHVGDQLEQIQKRAADRRIAFESDPAPAGFRKAGDVFMLRPDANWPAALGCKFVAEHGEVVEVRK